MGSKICMNGACGATTSSESKKGWSLKSGGFAKLCYACGSVYEKSVYCETFHSEESGWRECRICGKGVHCGCIASRNLHEYMDYGGIACITCAKRLEIQSQQQIQIPNNIPNGTPVMKNSMENRVDEDKFSTERLLQLTKAIRVNDVTSAHKQLKREEIPLKTSESSKRIPNPSPSFVKSDNFRLKQGVKDLYESLNFSLATPSGSSLPFSGGIVEGSEQSKGSIQRNRHIFPKPPKPGPTVETNKGSVSQTRVARPPADGRGRNQLLPRYWPRITDQELQQLSGDLKSTIVPLFEKILSASDAGRIGRLVLPKACAEAYFPTINQSEGIPIRIQDIKGKEWTFQFRFWPNNNSRMYVLEGVTPCIQNMQLQAGDTVSFSRIDPGGQLVIGCRKATNNADMQDFQVPVVPNGDSQGETSSSGVGDNRLSNGGRAPDDSFQLSMSEKKKVRNIKNKRLLMHSDDAMELRITWEEAQELFRPSPSSEPTVVMIEDHEFEEYEEPPVFGKRTIFISRPSGEQEQMAQCDSCSKWRRLPVHALLSANWTCSDNMWDPNRCSCSAPEDVNPRDLDFFGSNKDYKKRRTSESKATPKEGEPSSGLDALATIAVLGDNIGDLAESSVGATTRHPRHRPGCSCIVCIQPPSGKGKHDPTCKCNVCLTVRRRFKTLMMRKKKRQSDREAELAQEKDNTKGPAKLDFEKEDNNNNNNNNNNNIMDNRNIENETNAAQLDLNCDPHREDEMLAEAASMMSLTTLMNAATSPLDMYVGPELAPDGAPQLGPCLVSRNSGASEDNVVADEGEVGEEINHEDG